MAMEQLSESVAERARILIVDDEEANVEVIRRLLQRAGYTQARGITNSAETLPIFLAWHPDLVLLDLHMPKPDGFELLERLREHIPPSVFVPVVVLTADATTETRQRALALGATDFLTKPFDAIEIRLRIEHLLQMRFLYLEVLNQNAVLEGRVRERTRELEIAHLETLERLALAAEYRDDDTGEHTQRVGATSSRLAGVLGLPIAQVEMIRRAAPLHDLGKIGVPDSILLKPEALTENELALMRGHAAGGARLVANSQWPLMQMAELIALGHHERWDGTGYPRGLAGETIALEARITAVADVFDALTHRRPYKEAWSVERAVAFVKEQRGRHFDPDVVDAFMDVQLNPAVANRDVTSASRSAIGGDGQLITHPAEPEPVRSSAA